ncbi:MAG: pyrimidine-nucleoside phosphorylase [Firmicutes bacterium]|jgi:pyrimidine-nucleoside phosphorylase|nr:pyrimidine-nucleoside phosphorylase [Bacillota bacterium]
MRAYDILLRKRQGNELSPEEIKWLVDGYTKGAIPDYQMAAWAMAVFFQGMSPAETAALTMAMADSGPRLDLSAIPGIKVDKHSTGGVGDKTTLVLAPLVAAAGVPVAKLSGRGLGHTGGTIDKLESIPGFRAELPTAQFLRIVREIGVAVASATESLAPADKKLYALRDATATVESIPLIAASILSKKIAGGADAIVFDVKCGLGAFMVDEGEGRTLARLLVESCRKAGRHACALLTSMDQPLGRTIGNALEVQEAIATLKGQGPKDLRELCLALGSEMLYLAGKAATPEEGQGILARLLDSGAALAKMVQWFKAQGGDPQVIDDPELLPQPTTVVQVKASQPGYVTALNARELALVVMALGAGRATKDDPIDPTAGIVLAKKTGDYVETGEVLATLQNRGTIDQDKVHRVERSFQIGDRPGPKPLILERIPANSNPSA